MQLSATNHWWCLKFSAGLGPVIYQTASPHWPFSPAFQYKAKAKISLYRSLIPCPRQELSLSLAPGTDSCPFSTHLTECHLSHLEFSKEDDECACCESCAILFIPKLHQCLYLRWRETHCWAEMRNLGVWSTCSYWGQGIIVTLKASYTLPVTSHKWMSPSNTSCAFWTSMHTTWQLAIGFYK